MDLLKNLNNNNKLISISSMRSARESLHVFVAIARRATAEMTVTRVPYEYCALRTVQIVLSIKEEKRAPAARVRRRLATRMNNDYKNEI